ncbi:MAG: hypothetical protein WCP63_10730 [Cyanobium sp. ELA712]
MGRSAGQLADGCSFPITLRCNSRALLIARGVRRDLLLQPPQGRDLLRIMQWIGWYSAMALNWLTGRCGRRSGQNLAVAGVACGRHQPLKQGVFQEPDA